MTTIAERRHHGHHRLPSDWRILHIDTETANNPAALGWQATLCTFGCAASVADPGGAIRLYGPLEIGALADDIEDADLVVTYNGTRFDLPLISAAAGRSLLPRRHADLWTILTLAGRSNVGWSMNEACKRTLGREKIGKGADAPGLFQAGRWGALFTYCLSDALLMRDLFNHLHETNRAITPDGDIVRPNLVRLLCGK